jgi:serine/threonine-protein kinase
MGGKQTRSWWHTLRWPWPGGSSQPDPLQAPLQPSEMPGLNIGSFALVRTIAHGAIGELHLANDTITNLPVALKTVRLRAGDGADPRTRERFLREAGTAARLQHPHIVSVFAAGIDTTGPQPQGWMAMEWVQGSDLTRYTQPARLLPEAVVLQITARVADALAYAHAQGVVHRDIKPANILINLPAHTVKVTDFGCAHLTDAERSRSGLMVGSPAYMAPEQLRGDTVDGRCDLYALGVVLFELLTGQPPFQAASMGTLLDQIARRPAPDLRALRPDLPDLLASVVARALSKRPEDRHADGTQLARELRLLASRCAPPREAVQTAARPLHGKAQSTAPLSTAPLARQRPSHEP